MVVDAAGRDVHLRGIAAAVGFGYERPRPAGAHAPGAGLDVTDILGGDEVEVQPLRIMHIAFSFPEPVEYETHAYHEDRRAGCWREVRCND